MTELNHEEIYDICDESFEEVELEIKDLNDEEKIHDFIHTGVLKTLEQDDDIEIIDEDSLEVDGDFDTKRIEKYKKEVSDYIFSNVISLMSGMDLGQMMSFASKALSEQNNEGD